MNLVVSWNRGTPKSFTLINGIFHDIPSILIHFGVPPFMETTISPMLKPYKYTTNIHIPPPCEQWQPDRVNIRKTPSRWCVGFPRGPRKTWSKKWQVRDEPRYSRWGPNSVSVSEWTLSIYLAINDEKNNEHVIQNVFEVFFSVLLRLYKYVPTCLDQPT